MKLVFIALVLAALQCSLSVGEQALSAVPESQKRDINTAGHPVRLQFGNGVRVNGHRLVASSTRKLDDESEGEAQTEADPAVPDYTEVPIDRSNKAYIRGLPAPSTIIEAALMILKADQAYRDIAGQTAAESVGVALQSAINQLLADNADPDLADYGTLAGSVGDKEAVENASPDLAVDPEEVGDVSTENSGDNSGDSSGRKGRNRRGHVVRNIKALRRAQNLNALRRSNNIQSLNSFTRRRVMFHRGPTNKAFRPVVYRNNQNKRSVNYGRQLKGVNAVAQTAAAEIKAQPTAVVEASQVQAPTVEEAAQKEVV